MLEDFDSNRKTPEPTTEFFQKLKNVEWENKRVENLFNRLHDLLRAAYIEKKRTTDGTFTTTQNTVLRLLSGCNATKEGRDKIDQNDVINVFKTYLKLLNTDITKLA